MTFAEATTRQQRRHVERRPFDWREQSAVEQAKTVRDAWWRCLMPPRDTTVNKWAGENRVLDSKASKQAGEWSTDKTPYLREPMQCISPGNPAQRIAIMKAARVGGSKLMLNLIGYTIAENPCPIILVQAPRRREQHPPSFLSVVRAGMGLVTRISAVAKGIGNVLGFGAGGQWGAASGKGPLRGWNPFGGSADADNMFAHETVRNRAHDLGRNDALVHGYLDAVADGVIGTGLRITPTPRYRMLERDSVWASEWAHDRHHLGRRDQGLPRRHYYLGHHVDWNWRHEERHQYLQDHRLLRRPLPARQE